MLSWALPVLAGWLCTDMVSCALSLQLAGLTLCELTCLRCSSSAGGLSGLRVGKGSGSFLVPTMGLSVRRPLCAQRMGDGGWGDRSRHVHSHEDPAWAQAPCRAGLALLPVPAACSLTPWEAVGDGSGAGVWPPQERPAGVQTLAKPGLTTAVLRLPASEAVDGRPLSVCLSLPFK